MEEKIKEKNVKVMEWMCFIILLITESIHVSEEQIMC